MDPELSAGHFFAAEEVRVEITKKDDSLLKWAKKQRGLFVDLDVPQQTAVAEVLAQFPRLIDTRKGRSGADPFVIALARTRDAVVATGENDDGSPDKPKIPTVCRHFGIRAIPRRPPKIPHLWPPQTPPPRGDRLSA